MGNLSNAEAFEGWHTTEQMMRPMKEMLRMMNRILEELAKNIKTKVQAMLESVQTAAEFRSQMDRQVEILNQQLASQIEAVRELSPELADRIELEKADLLEDMNFQLDMIGATWKDGKYQEYVDNLCKDLSGFAELSSIAKEFEQTKDVDMAMSKVEAVHESIQPMQDLDKHREYDKIHSQDKSQSKNMDRNMGFEKNFEKSARERTPADEFDERIKNAKRQAKAFNMSPEHQRQRQRQMQMNMGQKMQDAMERCL